MEILLAKQNLVGAYYLGADFSLAKFLKLKMYALSSFDVYSFAAMRLAFNYSNLDAKLGFVAGFEHKYSAFQNEHFSYIAHGNIAHSWNLASYKLSAQLGYINTSYRAGLGSLGISGLDLNPFFYWSGDALLNQRALHLPYAKLGFEGDFGDIYLLYGHNWFKTLRKAQDSFHNQGELNIYASIKIINCLNLILHFINTHGGNNIMPNITQGNVLFKFYF